MRLSLPILFLLFVICFLLFVTPSFAQEITPTPSLQQVSLLDTPASTNPLDEILQRFEIPKILGKIFLAAVPLEVGQSADVVPTGSDNHDWTFDASRNYFLDSSKETSSQNALEIATTKKEDFLQHIMRELNGLYISIFGNQKAKEFFAKEVPLEVSEKALKDDEMIKSLPMSQCAALPLTVGNCAKSNTLEEIPPITPPAIPTITP